MNRPEHWWGKERVFNWLKRHGLLATILAAWTFMGFWFFIEYYVHHWKLTWEVITGFSTWMLAAGVVFAVWQIIMSRNSAKEQAEQVRKSTNAQIAIDLFLMLRSEETKETLRFIYSLNRETLPIIYHKDRYRIENLVDKFELLGALVNEEIVDKHLAIESYAGPPALRCWYQLAKFIRETNTERGFYDIDFEDFVRRTVEYFSDRNIDVKFSNAYEKDIHLVSYFKKQIEKNEDLRPRKLDEIMSVYSGGKGVGKKV